MKNLHGHLGSYNCGMLTVASADYISSLNQSISVSYITFNGHQFLAIGNITRECLELPMSNWSNDIYVVDVWANTCCLASQYPEKFAQKMEKWHNDHKFILNNWSWISPTDEGWLSIVETIPKIHTRVNYTDGRFEYFYKNAID